MSFDEKTITSAEMRCLDLNSEFLGVKPLQLMESAGLAVSDLVSKRFGRGSKVVVMAGVGRNGGDGMVAARHLASRGFEVEVVLVGREDRIVDELVLANWKAIKSMELSVKIGFITDSSDIGPLKCDVLIDAILGTGARGVLRPPIREVVKEVNRSKCFRVAVDVPTGVDPDTGEVMEDAVKADVTVSFHRLKRGLKGDGGVAGEVVVADIGIPREAEVYAGPGDVGMVKRERPSQSHKGDFGRVLVVGGSEVFTGAPALVGLAALRVGVDLAYVAAPEKTARIISAYSPNLITVKLRGDHFSPGNVEELDGFLEKSSVVAVGPGLGTHEETREALSALYSRVGEAGKPVVIDADAISLFGRFSGTLAGQVVLTPHWGEFFGLTGVHPSLDVEERVGQVRKAARDKGATILLKGNADVISDGERFKLNRTGNPGMTVGGTGDVLTGVVSGFLAQGCGGFEASVAAAFVNGAAGDLVYQEKGFHMVASDLIERIPWVIEHPMLAPRHGGF